MLGRVEVLVSEVERLMHLEGVELVAALSLLIDELLLNYEFLPIVKDVH
jgi:hypothetical protein